MKFLMLTFLLVATGAAAQTGELRLEQFRYRAGIDLSGPGPFHQVTLPMSVYQGIQEDNLADLRVFNGKAEVVPHALLRRESSSVSQSNEVAVPIFPLTAASKQTDGDLTVDVRKNADGTLVSVRQSGAAAGDRAIVRGVVADLSKLQQEVKSRQQSALRSLRLNVGPTATPFHAYTVETSDDLQQWRSLVAQAQLVRLEHDGQRVEQSSVKWDGKPGNYLRILWADPQQAPSITGLTIGIVDTASNRPALIWSGPIVPSRVQPHTYDYTLPGHMPLSQIRINLPQVNTLAPMQIQRGVDVDARRRRHPEWESLAHTVAFRLQSPQGEVMSPDIAVEQSSASRLRLQVDARSGGVGNVPPTLQIGFVPHVLVFLPRGDGPFTLAWGASGVSDAALPVSTLVPGYSSDKKLEASVAALQAVPSAPVNAAKAEPAPAVSKGVLWAVLLIGVAVLGGMVWMLSRQMRQKE